MYWHILMFRISTSILMTDMVLMNAKLLVNCEGAWCENMFSLTCYLIFVGYVLPMISFSSELSEDLHFSCLLRYSNKILGVWWYSISLERKWFSQGWRNRRNVPTLLLIWRNQLLKWDIYDAFTHLEIF